MYEEVFNYDYADKPDYDKIREILEQLREFERIKKIHGSLTLSMYEHMVYVSNQEA